MELTKEDIGYIASERYAIKTYKWLKVTVAIAVVGLILLGIGMVTYDNGLREYQYSVPDSKDTVKLFTSRSYLNIDKVLLNGVQLTQSDNYSVPINGGIQTFAPMVLIVVGGLMGVGALLICIYFIGQCNFRKRVAEKAFVLNGNSITGLNLED
jgi:hypothetical protein